MCANLQNSWLFTARMQGEVFRQTLLSLRPTTALFNISSSSQSWRMDCFRASRHEGNVCKFPELMTLHRTDVSRLPGRGVTGTGRTLPGSSFPFSWLSSSPVQSPLCSVQCTGSAGFPPDLCPPSSLLLQAVKSWSSSFVEALFFWVDTPLIFSTCGKTYPYSRLSFARDSALSKVGLMVKMGRDFKIIFQSVSMDSEATLTDTLPIWTLWQIYLVSECFFLYIKIAIDIKLKCGFTTSSDP